MTDPDIPTHPNLASTAWPSEFIRFVWLGLKSPCRAARRGHFAGGLARVFTLVRAKRGKKGRAAVSPLVEAAEVYQSLLLGKGTMLQSSAEAAEQIVTDTFTTGP